MNQKVQNLIDDTDRLDEEIEESEDYDDKIGQHVDLINRIVMYKRTPATISNWNGHHQCDTAQAGIANFLWRLQGLDVLLRPIQWSSDKQQLDNRQSKVSVSIHVSEKRCRKAFDLSPNHIRKLQ